MILYLHGFRSSPLSFKAQLIENRLSSLGRSEEYSCPQLPASPKAAFELAYKLAKTHASESLTLIGSSLGGLYATALAEKIGCRAILLNPAVTTSLDLTPYIGRSSNFHTGEPFEFKSEYVAELRALEINRITLPQRYFLFAATGDEILDWRDMVRLYHDVHQHIITGSNHALSNFENYLDEILIFSGISPS